MLVFLAKTSTCASTHLCIVYEVHPISVRFAVDGHVPSSSNTDAQYESLNNLHARVYFVGTASTTKVRQSEQSIV